MQKIISLYQRNYDGDRLVRDEVVPGAEWVLAGEGVPTRKMDGTSCLVRDGRLYKRYDRKGGKPAPAGWIAAEEAPNEHTGHWPGWLPVGDGPEDEWHREAWSHYEPDHGEGTFELLGPKVQGNPEGLDDHRLVRHGGFVFPEFDRTFDGIRNFIQGADIEGIVWHHPDGRMVKIKGKDFGLKRGAVLP